MTEADDFIVSETDGITISAGRSFMGRNNSQNLWGYYFCIENNTSKKIQLVGKDWNITDDRGNCFSDNKAGFKGEIPELEPGESFEFSDIAPIDADAAVFYGSCRVLAQGRAESMDISLPTFEMSRGKICAQESAN